MPALQFQANVYLLRHRINSLLTERPLQALATASLAPGMLSALSAVEDVVFSSATLMGLALLILWIMAVLLWRGNHQPVVAD